MLAVIEIGDKQYTVEEGSIIDVEKINAEPKDKFIVDRVLLIADEKNNTTLGKPYISGAAVQTTVLDQYKDKKVTVFKFKPKTGYKKTQGHRQFYTTLKVETIELQADAEKLKAAAQKAPKKETAKKPAEKAKKA